MLTLYSYSLSMVGLTVKRGQIGHTLYRSWGYLDAWSSVLAEISWAPQSYLWSKLLKVATRYGYSNYHYYSSIASLKQILVDITPQKSREKRVQRRQTGRGKTSCSDRVINT